MRVVVLLLALSLSGCLAAGPASEPPDAASEAGAAPPEPVRVVHRIDLAEGLDETTWEATVAPGYTHGHVLVRLEGPEGAGQYASQGVRIVFEGVQDDGSRYGTRAGVTGFESGTARDFVSLSGDDFDSGWYRVTASAQPSLAVLVVEVVAEYG